MSNQESILAQILSQHLNNQSKAIQLLFKELDKCNINVLDDQRVLFKNFRLIKDSQKPAEIQAIEVEVFASTLADLDTFMVEHHIEALENPARLGTARLARRFNFNKNTSPGLNLNGIDTQKALENVSGYQAITDYEYLG